MKMIVTVTLLSSDYSFDIQVNGEQKIIDTLAILSDSLSVRLDPVSTIKYVRSMRTGRRINTEYTYSQAKIHTGDRLLV